MARLSPGTLIAIFVFALITTTGILKASGNPPVELLEAQPVIVKPSKSVDLNTLRADVSGSTKIRLFKPSAQTPAVLSNVQHVELKYGEYLSVTGANLNLPSISGAQGEKFTPLPLTIHTLRKDGRMRELVIGHYHTDLHWQSDTGQFLADLLIGAFDRSNQAAQDVLQEPIPVQLVGPRNSLNLEFVRIGHLGVPYEKVEIASRTPLKLHIFSPIEPDGGREISIGIVKPKLVIQASPSVIDGLGLESTRITVSLIDATLPSGTSFTLNATSGKLEDTMVKTDAGGHASTILRSTGLGQTTLSIMDNRFDVVQGKVLFRPPYGFAIATILGALLGAFALVAKKKAEDRDRNYLWHWLTGLLLGIGITVALYAGLDIPGMLPMPSFIEGRAVPFAVAFVAALLGSMIVDKMVADRKA